MNEKYRTLDTPMVSLATFNLKCIALGGNLIIFNG